MSKGRLLAFRTGDIALDSVLAWAVRECPEMLLHWGRPATPSDTVPEPPEDREHDGRRPKEHR